MQTSLYRIDVSFGGAAFARWTEKRAIYNKRIISESAVSLGNEGWS